MREMLLCALQNLLASVLFSYEKKRGGGKDLENGNIQIHFQIREMRNRLLPCSELLSQLLDRLFMSERSLASLQGHAHPYNYHRLSFFSDMKLEFLSHLCF